MEIDKNITFVFENASFRERYKTLCDKYHDFNNKMNDENYFEIERFLLKKYESVKYMKKEKFFIIKGSKEHYDIQFNIIPFKGFIQFVIDIKKNKKRLNIAYGTWESIIKSLIGFEVDYWINGEITTRTFPNN